MSERRFPFALHHSKATNRALCNSVGMRENAGNLWTRIIPNTDTFYAVEVFFKKAVLKNFAAFPGKNLC